MIIYCDHYTGVQSIFGHATTFIFSGLPSNLKAMAQFLPNIDRPATCTTKATDEMSPTSALGTQCSHWLKIIWRKLLNYNSENCSNSFLGAGSNEKILPFLSPSQVKWLLGTERRSTKLIWQFMNDSFIYNLSTFCTKGAT